MLATAGAKRWIIIVCAALCMGAGAGQCGFDGVVGLSGPAETLCANGLDDDGDGDADCADTECTQACADRDAGDGGVVCGDDVCGVGETCESCAFDCSACPPSCGDALCATTETSTTCPQDCSPSKPCPDTATNAFHACYYADQGFTTLVLVRTEATVDFDWLRGAPATGIGVDNFSIIWQGDFSFEAASYDFTTSTDDGVRLYVDGALVYESWIDQAATPVKTTVPMLAGSHRVRVEYYENQWDASAKLSWAKVVAGCGDGACAGSESCSSCPADCCITGAMTTKSYQEDTSLIANPERGVYGINTNNFGGTSLPQPLSVSVSYLNNMRQSYGTTTCVPTYGLSAYKSSLLPQSVLDLVDGDFATARTNGFKLIPRFNYTNPEGGPDATPERINAHLQQLKPIFAKNADVMALGGLGMYGYWGEQWGTLNSTGYRIFEANDNTRAIFAGMLDAVPPDRMFMMRNTWTMRQLMGDEPCPESEAFTGTARCRVGHYNDCFLQEGSAENEPCQGPWSYTSVQGASTPDLAVADPSCGVRPSCQLVTDNLKIPHFDFIQADELGLLTGVSESDPCVQDVYRKIGYRYRLISTTITSAVRPGGAFKIDVSLRNDGYGSIFNPRDIQIILRQQASGAKYYLDVIGDDAVRHNRTYFPKSQETKTWTIVGGIPVSAPAGDYDVLLNLPDPYPSIRTRAAYSVHLANTGVWEAATGYNSLGQTLSVTPTATGAAYSGRLWFAAAAN